ncbi:Mss4-like protein [Clohesyomyces aquaticus]|uniref:Mss4-like protein n=1 Tax=Clohesyomyces aquaticus TaxID=1231657 RepID=A0A1Y1YUQ8_9PLEO|nr:Mss4-like protein [Clohesyomyces aquaticus]
MSASTAATVTDSLHSLAVEPETVTITAQCLCKAHTFTTKVPSSSLPLRATACHCDSCRHVSGAMYCTDIPWPEPRADVDTSALKKYTFSSRINDLFCGTCSTRMFFEDAQEPHDLGVLTGALTNQPGDIVKIEKHIFVGDTMDGGATMWMRKSGIEAFEETSREESLPIRCKCKGINFLLNRGNYDNKKAEDLPWFVDPKTHKLLGGFCPCDSCRLFGSADVFNWTYAELENIYYGAGVADEGRPFPKNTAGLKAAVDAKDPSVGTLAYYASSPDVQRYFCGDCAASIFYAVDDRPDIVDVAIGVLEASDGARAEGFLSWGYGGMSGHYTNDAKGGWREGFLKLVDEECDEWRNKRGYPKCWRRVAREGAEAQKATMS